MSRCAEDVTALVLTVGETTFEAAVEALNNQTTPPTSRVVVDNTVKTFHAAFNHGVAKVKTEFLLQCDADMILDPDCIEVLRGCMTPEVGIAAAFLEDPLLGFIQAVKLFRTESVKRRPLPPTLTTDSDRAEQLHLDREKIIFVERDRPRYGHPSHVLGSHQPPYDDPLYTFGRFHRLGRKTRLRHSYPEFQNILHALKGSRHMMADHAIAALCIGCVADRLEGPHEPFHGNAEYETYIAFANESPPDSVIRRSTKKRVVWSGPTPNIDRGTVE